MGEQTTPGIAGTPVIKLDGLIIGGGIMGLWLLMELHRLGYAVLLLERRELGGGQTGHSHVYIHLGYLYDKIELARHLKEVHGQWQEWFEDHPPQYKTMSSHFGFRNPADAKLKMDLWEHPELGLKSVEVPRNTWPAALQGSTVQGGLQNLWAVWPTKLTLAPKASRTMMRHIRGLIPQPGHWASLPPAWRTSRVPADVAPELRTKTPLVSWDTFRQLHGI